MNLTRFQHELIVLLGPYELNETLECIMPLYITLILSGEKSVSSAMLSG
jgi:hypothetical protein